MSTRTPIGHDLLEQLASLEAVDGLAKPLAKAVRGIKAPAKVNEALSGTWLGHPVHPLLIVVPMGSWISAVLLDWLGGEDAESAADLLVGVGVAGRGADGGDGLQRLGRHRARVGHRAADRAGPRGVQRDRRRAVRRLAGRPRLGLARPRQAARAGRPGVVGVGRLPRGPPHLRRGRRRQRRHVRGIPAGLDPGAGRRRAGRGRDARGRRRRRRDPDRPPRRRRSTRSRTRACTAAARWPTASSSATACSARCTARASGSTTARSSRARPPTRSRRSRRACATARSRYGRTAARRRSDVNCVWAGDGFERRWRLNVRLDRLLAHRGRHSSRRGGTSVISPRHGGSR